MRNRVRKAHNPTGGGGVVNPKNFHCGSSACAYHMPGCEGKGLILAWKIDEVSHPFRQAREMDGARSHLRWGQRLAVRSQGPHGRGTKRQELLGWINGLRAG